MSTPFPEPVIIVGAPRSGTSLLQQVLREHPAFVSVPRESDVIWWPYVHPRLNDWQGEGFHGRALADGAVEAIRAGYASRALPAAVWSRFSGAGIMRMPRLARAVRAVYPLADRLVSGLRSYLPARHPAGRLVDKSVHFGLWLDAVERVFPDARLVHVTRHPESCIRSMIAGWREPGRFETWRLPEALQANGVTHWCFPLPAGWRELLGLPLAERVAGQWCAIQAGILAASARARDEGRYLRLHLEDLSGAPEPALRALADFAGLRWDDYFERLARDLPVVNAGRPGPGADTAPAGTIGAETTALAARLGY